jgi:hypothetical protein
MRELYRLLGIKIGASTAYYPQTDGQTEWVNQELEQFIQLFVNECQDNWNSLLPLAEFAYNNHVHSSTQQTPFFLDTSRHLRMGFEPNQRCLPTPIFNPGDKVFLDASNIHTTQPSKKFSHPCLGPYSVKCQVSLNAY